MLSGVSFIIKRRLEKWCVALVGAMMRRECHDQPSNKVHFIQFLFFSNCVFWIFHPIFHYSLAIGVGVVVTQNKETQKRERHPYSESHTMLC